MVRLDKCIADLGLGSRKDAKKWIKEKRVAVNGNYQVKDDFKVVENDEIMIDEDVFVYHEFVYIMLNKPQGVISATEDRECETVIDLLSDTTKGLFPVGRLDKDTVGLCLITNDGQLAHQLLSNKKHVEKEYVLLAEHELSDDDISEIQKGIVIDGDEQCLPADIFKSAECEYHMIIQEGKYHQVKRMLEAVDNKVEFLKRIRMKNLLLDEELDLGEWRYLSSEEIESLKK